MAKLKEAKEKETNTFVKQDLDILINHAELGFKIDDFDFKRQVTFMNATGDVFGGLQGLLDDQTAPERRKAEVVCLRKYAGLQEGYEPIVAIYKARKIGDIPTSTDLKNMAVVLFHQERGIIKLQQQPELIFDEKNEYKFIATS